MSSLELQLDARTGWDENLNDLCLQVAEFAYAHEKGKFRVTVLLSHSEEMRQEFDCETVTPEAVVEAFGNKYLDYLRSKVDAIEASPNPKAFFGTLAEKVEDVVGDVVQEVLDPLDLTRNFSAVEGEEKPKADCLGEDIDNALDQIDDALNPEAGSGHGFNAEEPKEPSE